MTHHLSVCILLSHVMSVLDSLEDFPDHSKIIEALVTGESESEIPTGFGLI